MRNSPFLIITTLVSTISISVAAGKANAQQDDLQLNAGSRVILKSQRRKPPPSPPEKPPGIRTHYIPKRIDPKVTPKTGTLVVAARANAHITVELNGKIFKEGKIPDDENYLIVSDLPRGSYKVAASLEGYTSDRTSVEVKPNEVKGISLSLEEVLYKVTIVTNVVKGEVRYAPVEVISDPQTRKTDFKPTGLSRLAEIRNYQAVLPELRKGTYGVDIRADDVGFDLFLGTVTVPSEDESADVTFSANLNKRQSTTIFSYLTADQWDIPATWEINNSLLTVNGPGVGIPRLDTYRHYKDFQLISDVRMVNSVAVSFVIHASGDKKNYYLVKIAGSKAKEPNEINFYIIKNDGTPERIQSITFSKTLIKEDQDFEVEMTMKDNKIEVKLSGQPLGDFTDANRNFPIGAVGIFAARGEQAQFGQFQICYPVCQK